MNANDFTKMEKTIARYLYSQGFRWIVRYKNGALYAYKTEPDKVDFDDDFYWLNNDREQPGEVPPLDHFAPIRLDAELATPIRIIFDPIVANDVMQDLLRAVHVITQFEYVEFQFGGDFPMIIFMNKEFKEVSSFTKRGEFMLPEPIKSGEIYKYGDLVGEWE